ncbi:hypothetical protein GCM10011391_08500 [Pullulanibacillus camelliae]|uniref:SCP domain-containing protein n=1 Tax=Pullulanibacillus camelliae TaxID=1707096 RepID=A0A8J2VMR1_9BACL|nr:CAP domain-containing protein [Pullulanibacillus camelliae]GGE32156.1 hypothetical protein GCM10011391_08500 [Pullulanibacillus camelliae]
MQLNKLKLSVLSFGLLISLSLTGCNNNGNKNMGESELQNSVKPQQTNQVVYTKHGRISGQAMTYRVKKYYRFYSNGTEYSQGPSYTNRPQGSNAPYAQQQQQKPSAQAPTNNATNQNNQSNVSSDTAIQQVVDLVNTERKKNGLPALKVDSSLTKMADAKAKDMLNNHYFSHTSPTYGSPFDMMKAFGISYKNAGENIAQGQTNAQNVMKDWMNSSGHRANILNKDYTFIGVGHTGSQNYWVQEFIKK